MKKTLENIRIAKLDRISQRVLKDNAEVFKSLREYDEGKKVISTKNIERHMKRIRKESLKS